MGSRPEVDRHYRPRRIPLGAALAGADARIEDIRYVVNCHLHFDHCGGNPRLAGVPVFTQRAELATARTVADHTLPELIDHATAFTGDVLGHRAGVGAPPEWIETLLALDPRRVVFAHDNAVWIP